MLLETNRKYLVFQFQNDLPFIAWSFIYQRAWVKFCQKCNNGNFVMGGILNMKLKFWQNNKEFECWQSANNLNLEWQFLGDIIQKGS